MKLIGLTGGIACGKSTVSEMFSKDFGCTVIDADKIAREALEPGNEPYEKVVDYFTAQYEYTDDKGVKQKGNFKIIKDDKQVDRDLLGSIAFSNPEVRKQLNSFTHGWVFKQIFKQIWHQFSWRDYFSWRKQNSTRVVILDVPLLYETKFLTYVCSKVIVVSVEPQELQLKRLMERNKQLTEEQAKQRIDSQLPLEKKRQMADFVIDNSGTLEDLKNNVAKVYDDIQHMRMTLLG